LTVRREQRDATEDLHRPQRRDEIGNAEGRDDQAIYNPGDQTDKHSGRNTKRDREVAEIDTEEMKRRGHENRGHRGGKRRNRRNRKINAARQNDECLSDRDHGQRCGLAPNIHEVRVGSELR
jgi:hypothetical protein